MVLDEVDREMVEAERLASPQVYGGRSSHEIERVATASSASTSTTSDSISRRNIGMSRMSTQRDLERHPTELSRIATQRSQHSGTVGRSRTTRTTRTRRSSKPLPEFGAGKPYPPPLPSQEEYVVEFDGPDDPLHPQNWPIKKK